MAALTEWVRAKARPQTFSQATGDMDRPKNPAARMIVEIDLVPHPDSGVNEDFDGQVLFPARIVVDGKPIQALRSQADWFLVKTGDWYLHLAWGARRQRPKRKR